jgi:hypothetical protein
MKKMNSTKKKLQKVEKKLKELKKYNEVILSTITPLKNEALKSLFRAMEEMIDTRLEIVNEMGEFDFSEADTVTTPGRYESLYFVSFYLCLLSEEENLPFNEYNKLSPIDKYLFSDELDVMMNEFVVEQDEYGFLSVNIFA